MDKRRYKHAVIVGLDGMGIFCKDTDTPCLDSIFEDGASTIKALSLFPTISAQNWGAMLIGTEPEVHGLTNGTVSQREYTNKELPSIFTTVRKAYPDSILCSVSNWEPINIGIIEHDIDVEMQTADTGEHTTDKIVECVKTRNPNLLFIQIDDPDEGGHHFGYGTKGHLESIRRSDAMVGRIYEAYKEAGIIDDTLFIVITDHGGYGHGHGGYTDTEKYIYLALKGKTVKKTKDFFATTKDINAIIRYAFGLDIPEFNIDGYSSQVPENLFTDWNKPYIQTPPGVRNDIESKPQPDFYGKDGLSSYFDKDEIKLAMFFEFNHEDSAEKVKFKEHGQIKYYPGGVRGAKAEIGATGCLTSEDVKFGTDDFTVCAWLNIDDAPQTEAHYCGTKTMTDSGPGFMLGFTNMATWLGVETPDPTTYQEHTLNYKKDFSGGWLHTAYSFNRKENKIDIYWNFKLKKIVVLPECFKGVSMDALPFTVGNEASMKINTENNALIYLDDLIVFGKAFDENDINKLKEYYN